MKERIFGKSNWISSLNGILIGLALFYLIKSGSLPISDNWMSESSVLIPVIMGLWHKGKSKTNKNV